MDNVPTPLMPRTWDPNRNIAYTPAVEAERSTPRSSPERKKLVMSTDQISQLDRTLNVSPKDTLLDCAPRLPLKRLSVPGESPALPGRGGVPAMRPSPGIHPRAAQQLPRKLHSCSDQLIQTQASLDDHSCMARAHGALPAEFGGYPDIGDPAIAADPVAASAHRHEIYELSGGGVDVLAATVPPYVGASTPGVQAPLRVLDTPMRVPAEGLSSARGRENAPPPNSTAVAGLTATMPWKGKQAVVRNGVMLHAAAPRYPAPASSPLKTRHCAGQPPQALPTTATTTTTTTLPGKCVWLGQQRPAATPATPAAAVWTQTTSAHRPRVRRASAPSQWLHTQRA